MPSFPFPDSLIMSRLVELLVMAKKEDGYKRSFCLQLLVIC
jgi:hypothetical protein